MAKSRAVRSLGTMEFPSWTLKEFNGRTNRVKIELTDLKYGKCRQLTVVSTVSCYALIRLIRQIATAQGDYATEQALSFETLKNRIRFEEDRPDASA